MVALESVNKTNISSPANAAGVGALSGLLECFEENRKRVASKCLHPALRNSGREEPAFMRSIGARQIVVSVSCLVMLGFAYCQLCAGAGAKRIDHGETSINWGLHRAEA